MTVKEFKKVFDIKSDCYVLEIDSAVNSKSDEFIELETDANGMIIDRIAHFKNPKLLIQESDCMEDFEIETPCEELLVIFAHRDTESCVNTKLKMEVLDDLEGYCNSLNEAHRHELIEAGYEV